MNELENDLRKNPSKYQWVADELVGCIKLYEASKSDAVDVVLWNGGYIPKDLGEIVFDVFGKIDKKYEKYKEYWTKNYGDIEKKLFEVKK